MKIIKPITCLIRFISGHNFFEIENKQRNYEMQRKICREFNQIKVIGGNNAGK